MGRYEVKMLRMGEMDRVQAFYFQIFERSGAVRWEDLEPISGYLIWAIKDRPVVAIKGGSGLGSQILRGMMLGQYSYQGRLDQAAVGKDTEMDFWKAARDHLQDFGWAPAIDAKLETLRGQ
jgi:hypothetical protein